MLLSINQQQQRRQQLPRPLYYSMQSLPIFGPKSYFSKKKIEPFLQRREEPNAKSSSQQHY